MLELEFEPIAHPDDYIVFLTDMPQLESGVWGLSPSSPLCSYLALGQPCRQACILLVFFNIYLRVYKRRIPGSCGNLVFNFLRN